MIDTEFEMYDYWISELLAEAGSYNLREEVKNTALVLIEQNPEIDVIEAYQIAFNEWVK